ncbi:putative bifunctional diguanylate cyclase/phosphodiesterase [Pseudooceanicola sp. LIPI14-2-Ac024]|uniref:putative bifunctional diguanylate cyclase/phosphodiesterase n=1 Tax=Pseudooceanicola sp. LIPI14-2-Ac024 TaxID=3344875 RepID=UPI0035CEED61
MAAALTVPVVYGLTGLFRPAPADDADPDRDSTTGLPLAEALEEALDDRLAMSLTRGRATACFLVALDDLPELADRHGQAAVEQVLSRTSQRLRDAVREGDIVCRTDQDGFGVGLATVTHLDLEIAIQLAARLQATVEEPIAVGSGSIYVSCSIGFCLGARAPEATGRGLIHAASLALDEARRNAPSAIRAFSREMSRRVPARAVGQEDVMAALEGGQILPFFQPQVSTDTGRVTGFEALARWCHPERGVIPPDAFLEALRARGQMERLGEVILTRALEALAGWDRAGLTVPSVAVNFSSEELSDPKLVDKVRWQLDRFDLAPERLCIEVLETVIAASPDDSVVRSVNGLAKLGCRVDLDDFGTGHASISSLRRFAVHRLKIDRSFVTKVDRDPDQQRLVAAILSLAEQMGLDSLAEGVETRGEHAMLAQLGCGHIQGYCIARPMPVEQTGDWLRAHAGSLADAPAIGRKLG